MGKEALFFCFKLGEITSSYAKPSWKKVGATLMAAGIVALGVFYATTNKGKKPVVSYVDPAFGEYIASYTAGIVASGSTIRIVLTDDVGNSSQLAQGQRIGANCTEADSLWVVKAGLQTLSCIYHKGITPRQMASSEFIQGRQSPTSGRAMLELAHRYPRMTIHRHLDGVYLGSTQKKHFFPCNPDAGRHVLVVVDENGETLEQQFSVLSEL